MISNPWGGHIDVFVICYERTPLLEPCLDSIRKYTTNVPHRLVVIEGKKNAAENRNIALSKVTSPWFVMMDDDVLVTSGWLERMSACISDDIGQIQPKVLFPNNKIFAAEKVFTTPWGDNVVVGSGKDDRGQFDYVRVAELLSGTCSLYNTKVLQSCVFDTNYKGAQWEDCDFSMQIRKNGFLLLYCGRSTVYHHHLFRNAEPENFQYFKKKWFGIRRLVQRGVLYVGLKCDLNCIFCYYKYTKEKTFKPLEKLKQECDTFRRFYKNTNVTITGGEPTIYPHIVELVEYARGIGLAPNITTHGQHLTKQMVEGLKRAGIEDFLISFHGFEKEHDYVVQKDGSYKRMRQGIENVINSGIRFRVNIVVTKINYKTLPALAREFLVIKASKVNFMPFNPWESWLFSPLEHFHQRYCQIAPYLKEAISILASSGVTAYASYMPFCLLEGFEKYVMNFPQLCFNNEWGWDIKCGYPLRGEYDYLYNTLMYETRSRYEQNSSCRICVLRLICSGLPKQYARTVGWDEIRPVSGMIVRDPLYFNTMKVETKSHIEHDLVAFFRKNFIHLYPWLKDSDPLVLYQNMFFEHGTPLYKRIYQSVRRFVKAYDSHS